MTKKTLIGGFSDDFVWINKDMRLVFQTPEQAQAAYQKIKGMLQGKDAQPLNMGKPVSFDK